MNSVDTILKNLRESRVSYTVIDNTETHKSGDSEKYKVYTPEEAKQKRQELIDQGSDEDKVTINPPISESRGIDTYINPEDKVSIPKLKSSIRDYPAGTYLRYTTEGAINAMSNNTYGLLKTGDDEWSPYSSFLGTMSDKVYTSHEVLDMMAKRGAKTIGVKLNK